MIAIVLSLLLTYAEQLQKKAEAESENPQTLAESSDLIVRGTIKEVGKSTVEDVEPTEHTVIVTVSEVIKPLKESGAARQAAESYKEITVILKAPDKVEKGRRGTFYTSGGITTNDGFAAEGTAILDQAGGSADAQAKRVTEQTAEAMKRQGEQALRKRVESANAVVAGVVSEVVTLPLPPDQRGPGSEHDPLLRRASVVVSDVAKGQASAGETVHVIFASSEDVAWINSPKLHRSDRGTLLLRDQPQRADATLRAQVDSARTDLQGKVFTALEAGDFIPQAIPAGAVGAAGAALPAPQVAPEIKALLTP